MAFRAGDSEIRNPDGTIVFQQRSIEVPEAWSQVATDVLAQKYFRRAGVARCLKKVAEADVPEWLWRSVPDEAAEPSTRIPKTRYCGRVRSIGASATSTRFESQAATRP